MLTKRLPPWVLLIVLGPIALKIIQLFIGYQGSNPGKFWLGFAVAVILAVVGVSGYVWDWFYHRRRQAASPSAEEPKP